MTRDEQQRDLTFIGEGKQLEIRRVWNAERAEWFYSIVDVMRYSSRVRPTQAVIGVPSRTG